MLPERLRPTIISAIGRIHLLLGDVGAAKECFAAVTSSQPEQEQLQNQLNRCASSQSCMGKLLYESNILHITSYLYEEVIYYSIKKVTPLNYYYFQK